MKKIFLIFCSLFFANVSIGWGAYFYADDLEYAIKESFPENVQSLVAEEYEAQMSDMGEIDEQGIYNVCYAGGFDVNTDQGAEKCNAFVQKANPVREYTAPYSGPYSCKSGNYQKASNGCKYSSGNGIRFYTNPTTRDEKIQKCVFDKAIDFALEWEGGFQQTKSDIGNRICDDHGRPLDEDGNVVTAETTKKVLLGATKYGITTCASGLSVECICVMSKEQAKQFFWTSMFYKYKYYTLPQPLQAGVMQLSFAGIGRVARELKKVVGAQHCKNTVVDSCILESVNRYMKTHTVEDFYEEISEERARKYSKNKKSNHYKRAIQNKSLSSAYDECAALY